MNPPATGGFLCYNYIMSKLEDIVSLCKRRGFIFPGSDVYGGMAGTWDFGPLGVSLKIGRASCRERV